MAMRNRLLSILTPRQRARIVSRCVRMDLPLGARPYEARAPMEAVYFPLTGVLSLMVASEDGHSLEAGMIGNEGMLGTSLVLGAPRMPLTAVVQAGGEFLRMGRDDAERELDANPALRAAAQRFAQALSNQIALSLLCNHLHSVDQRLCRWLLMRDDRSPDSDIASTHDFMARMLGVRRASVSVAMAALEAAGLVRTARGRVGVRDHDLLADVACECYRVGMRDKGTSAYRVRARGQAQ